MNTIKKHVALLLAFSVLPATNAWSLTLYWTDITGGLYQDGNNWSNLGIPDPADNVIFDLGAYYTVTFSGNVTQNQLNVYNDSVIFDLGGYTYTNSTTVRLAENATDLSYLSIRNGSLDSAGALYAGVNGSGALEIRNNGQVANTSSYVGYLPGSSGAVYVDGSGSSWSSSSLTYIGYQGAGDLTIVNGADVNSGSSYIGRIAGGTGSVTVNGTGSTWTTTGSLFVGRDGDGTVDIQNDADVTSGVNAHLGYSAGSNGAVTIDGAGSSWTNTYSLYIGGTTSAAGGTGTLTVQNGGSLVVGDTIKLWAGGTLNLDGGSITTTNFDASEGGLNLTDGALTVDGGTFTKSGNLILRGSRSGHNPTLQLINGATGSVSGLFVGGWESGGTLSLLNGSNLSCTSVSVGDDGSGSIVVDGPGTALTCSSAITLYDRSSMSIINGGSVSNTQATLYGGANRRASVTVDGAGSTWTNTGDLLLGGVEGGIITIRNGGSVTSVNGVIGDYADSDSSVTVDGIGSSWTNSGTLSIGDNSGLNKGILTIQNGGTVSNTDGYIAQNPGDIGEVTVNGAGSSWTNSADLFVGEVGSGSLTIQNGGMVSNAQSRVGNQSGSNGIVIVDGSGSSWISSVNLFIGNNGAGNLSVTNGGNVASGASFVGAGTGSSGAVAVDGTGSAWINVGNLYLGLNGTGILNIQNGGSVSNSNGLIGHNSGSIGNATVAGLNSIWTNTSSVYVGGGTTEAGGTGTLDILGGGTVNIAGILKVWNTGTVELTAATLNVGDLDAEGTFNFNSGSLNIGNNFDVGFAGPLGYDLTLNTVHQLSVGNATTIDLFSALTLDGGTFSTGYLVNNGVFNFQRGTFNLTNDNLTIGAGGLLSSNLYLDYSRSVNVTNGVTVASDGLLSLNTGTFTGGAIINNGTIDLQGASSTLAGGTLTNYGLISGDGRLTTSLSNNVGGELAVNTADNLTLTSSGNANSGQISLLGGTIRFEQDLTNNSSGIISGSGNLIVSGGLTNEGTIALSGGTSGVGGNVNNTTGTIIVSGNSTATFFDDVIHNGAEFRVSDGSSAVFFGSVSGSGSYTGTGQLYFEGDLDPGNSPGLVDVEGDLHLGIGSHTLMEIAGLVRGDEYDAFDIGGDLFLDGELQISLYDDGDGLFAPKLGDSFDLFSAETLNGSFDILTLAVLGEGLGWQLDYLTDAIGSIDVARLSVVASTVPVPAAVWLFGSGLLGLIAVGRRRQSH